MSVRLLSSPLFVLLCVSGMKPLVAQQLPVGDPLEGYLRMLSAAGYTQGSRFAIRPIPLEGVMVSLPTDVQHPWMARYGSTVPWRGRGIKYMPLESTFRASWNSDHPVVKNDGPVWLGKGATVEITGGGALRFGPITASFQPTLFYSQNQDFEIVDVGDRGISVFGIPHLNFVDLPQRFGADPYWDFDLGQSSIRVDYGLLAAGFSTENMWWGPGTVNAIVMSNNAPGFTHAFLATSKPANIGIGTVEAKWIWGRLRESKFFDDIEDNDTRFVTGIVLDLQPKPLEGLNLGGTRLFYDALPPEGLPFSDHFLVFQGLSKNSQNTPGNPTGNDARDQLLSLFARWVLPESDLELYIEWARNDHSRDFRDFVLQPGHSEGYTIGFLKVIETSNRNYLRVVAEGTHLEASKTLLDRTAGTFYANDLVTQGYTQLGQVVGAGIGPGGNSQHFAVGMYAPWGNADVFFFRQVHNNDTYYRLRQLDLLGVRQNDVEFTFGATGRFFLPSVDVSGTLAIARELNRYYILRNDVTNLHAQFAVHHRWLR